MPPAKPRTPPEKGQTIEQQITGAIAQGFTTVLSDQKAVNAEILSALKDISRQNRMEATRTGSKPVAAHVAEEGVEHLSRRLSAPHGESTPSVVPAHEQRSGSLEHRTREDIRERLAGAFARRAESWTTGALAPMRGGEQAAGVATRLRRGVSMDENGRFHENGRYISASQAYETVKMAHGTHLDENGVARDAAGLFRHVEAASADEVAALTRRQALARSATDVAQAWSSGQPFARALANALPQKFMAGVGVGAVALGAANETWQRIQEQYATNRKYQEYYGGSNAAQFGERADQWMNSNIRGRFSLLGGEAYGELWNQAMGMGMRGSHRSDYINIGASMMSQGVNAEQTQELLKLNIEAGGATKSMRELANVIASVNQVARDAGVSAKEAREIFIQNYKASTSGILGGTTTAMSQASALTTSQVSMGHAYANRVDYSGTMARNVQYANARQLGLTPSQYNVMQQTTSTLPGMVAGEDRVRQQLNGMANSSGKSMQQVVNEFIQSLGREFEPELDTYNLGLAIEMAGFNRDAISAVLGANGIQADAASAPGIAGNLFTSNAPSQVAARQQESTVAKFMGKPNVGSSVKVGQSVSASGGGGISGALDVQPGWDKALGDIYTNGKTNAEQVWTRTPGTVELELLRNIGTYGLDPSTRVVVKTASGDRAVTLQEALKSFSDQITNGSVKILEGEHQGKSIADLMGFAGTDVARQAAPSTLRPSTAGTDVSTAMAQINDEEKASGDSESDSVTIDLKPRVAEIFDIFLNGKYYSAGPTG